MPGPNPIQTQVSGSTGFCLDVPGRRPRPGFSCRPGAATARLPSNSGSPSSRPGSESTSGCRAPGYDLVVCPDGAVRADLDIYCPQRHGKRAGSERRAIHDRWRAEPADQRGDGDDVEFIDQAGSQESAVEPASGLRYQAPGAELRADLRQRGTQIHLARTGDQIGNPLLTQDGQIRQGRAVAGYDQQARPLVALVRPCTRPRASTTANHRGLR